MEACGKGLKFKQTTRTPDDTRGGDSRFKMGESSWSTLKGRGYLGKDQRGCGPLEREETVKQRDSLRITCSKSMDELSVL